MSDLIPANIAAYLPPDFYRYHPSAQQAAYRRAEEDAARFGPPAEAPCSCSNPYCQV